MKYYSKRYKLFGWDYEFHCPLKKEGIDLYRYISFIKETGRLIFELACGTGRVLYEIAKKRYSAF